MRGRWKRYALLFTRFGLRKSSREQGPRYGREQRKDTWNPILLTPRLRRLNRLREHHLLTLQFRRLKQSLAELIVL